MNRSARSEGHKTQNVPIEEDRPRLELVREPEECRLRRGVRCCVRPHRRRQPVGRVIHQLEGFVVRRYLREMV